MRNALIRLGLGSIGLVYVAMGVVSARIALGAHRRGEGVPGALRFLLEQPYGPYVLGAVVAGLLGIALVYGVESVTGKRRLVARLGLLVGAIGYAVTAWTSVRVLLHVGRKRGSFEQAGVVWLLNVPGGTTLLAVIAVIVIAAALWEIVQGVRGPVRPARPPRAIARGLMLVARFGLIARGLVLGTLGYFLLRAAEESDPHRAQTFGGVLRAFSHTAVGPAFVGVVALGLAAYGVHLWTLALWRRKA